MRQGLSNAKFRGKKLFRSEKMLAFIDFSPEKVLILTDFSQEKM